MPAISLAEFRTRLTRLYASNETRPSTGKRIDQLAGELIEQLGPDATTAQLTTDAIAAWKLAHPGRSKETVIGYLGCLRAACTWAFEEGWIERQPSWKRLRPRRRSGSQAGPHLDLGQIRLLLGHLAAKAADGGWTDQRLYALVSVATYTGLRRNELLFLRCSDFDLAAEILLVVPRKERELKTPESCRPVPIAPELRPIVASWLPLAGSEWFCPGLRHGRPWSSGRVGYRPIDRLRQAAAEVGIDHITWQTLRRGWSVYAEGVWACTDPEIERVLGHTCPTTSKRWYRKANVDNLRAIGARIRLQEMA